MAIYTKRGDRGQTSLYGGKRTGKDNQRIAAYGSVDELQSQLGFVSSLLPRRARDVKARIREIQEDLFQIEAELSAPRNVRPPLEFGGERTKEIEKLIDELEGKLPVLANFIFPGGSLPGAAMHVARTVARRAEREVVRLSRRERVNPNIIVYLNRLSDLLFMLAREINRIEKSPEEKWRA